MFDRRLPLREKLVIEATLVLILDDVLLPSRNRDLLISSERQSNLPPTDLS